MKLRAFVLLFFAATCFGQSPGKHVVSLNCTDGTGVNFNWYRAVSATATPVKITTTPVQPCAFTDSTVSLNTTYWYTATTVQNGSESVPSVQVMVKIPDVPATVATVGVVQSGSTATVTWTASPQIISGYNIYRGTTAANLTKIGTVPSGTVSYIDSTAPTGTNLYAVSVTSNACSPATVVFCGEGALSVPVSVVVPSAPTGLTFTVN